SPDGRVRPARSGTAPKAGLENANMRKQILKAAGAATLFGVLAMVGVSAQAAQIRADIPFSFECNRKVLPSGTYTVDPSVANGLVTTGKRPGAVVPGTQRYASGGSPRLVFHKYGDEYILREVWLSGTNGKALPESRRERELAAARGGAHTASVQRVEVPL